jgi:integrase
MLSTMNRKVTTAERHLSAIAHMHHRANVIPEWLRDARQIATAVRRERKEQPKGKEALRRRDLVSIARKCDGRTALGARDRALIVLGFATNFRRTELALLKLSDISFERRGLAVLLRYSKRDQEGEGKLFAIWRGKRDFTDPVRVLRTWLNHRGTWEGPLFCRIQSHDTVMKLPISGEAVNEIVKRRVASIGIDPGPYGTHSLRAGAITTSAELGRSDQEIMGMSGHSSAKVMKMYVRSARLFAGRNPLAGVL